MNVDLKKWFDLVENDSDLSQELLLKKAAYDEDGKSSESFISEVFVPEAKKYGFEISVEDVESFIDNTGLKELSLDELEDVAGGRSKVLMNVGVVSMALMSILPMAGAFMNKGNSASTDTNTAVVSTVKNENASGKNVKQGQGSKAKSANVSQTNKVQEKKSTDKN